MNKDKLEIFFVTTNEQEYPEHSACQHFNIFEMNRIWSNLKIIKTIQIPSSLFIKDKL